MGKPRCWVLTDVQNSVWQESFNLCYEELGVHGCTISKCTLHGGLRDGVDLVEVTNGLLSFSLIPTRGMGIWKGDYRGIPLGWSAPTNGPVHPKFVNLLDTGGLGWLKGFDEWIVRCGLHANGPPGEDVVQDSNGNSSCEHLTLHGKIANLPSHYVEVVADADSQVVSVTGLVDESALFCPGLRLRTTISTGTYSNRLTIKDEISNLRATPAELELLYHCNFARPFMEAQSRLLAPILELAPRDSRSAEGIMAFDTYLPPTVGYTEQAYFFDLAGDEQHRTLVALRNSEGNKAVALRFNKLELPCFSQWKNTAALEDGYVTGLEPGTNYPNMKRFERDKGRVIRIEPGESYCCEVTIEICDAPEQVAAIEAEVTRLQMGFNPRIHDKPHPRFSPT